LQTNGYFNLPSLSGYSHKPEEYASPEDMANGVKVLALTMAKAVAGVTCERLEESSHPVPKQTPVLFPTISCTALASPSSSLHQACIMTIIHQGLGIKLSSG